MPVEVIYVLCLFLLALLLFALEPIPVDETSFYIMVLLVLAEILTPAEAVRGFGNETLLTLACMFILASGLIRTGVIDAAARQLLLLAPSAPRVALGATLGLATVLSAFVNNTPVVVMFIPLLIAIAKPHGISTSRLLIPLSFLATAGGTCTIIGSSTNLLVNAMMEQTFGMEPLRFFETGGFGLFLVLFVGVYLLVVGPALLPDRPSVVDLVPRSAPAHYVTQIRIGPGFRDLGKPITEVRLRSQALVISHILRGGASFWPPFGDGTVRVGDVWILHGPAQAIGELKEERGIELFPLLEERLSRAHGRESILVELLVPPASGWIGKRISDLRLWSHYRVNVLGVQRRGEHRLREQMEESRLEMGDILLALSPSADLHHLKQEIGFVLLDRIDKSVFRETRRIRAAVIFACVVVGMFLTNPSLHVPWFQSLGFLTVAMTGVAAMLLGGCLTLSEAYGSLDRKVLMLIVGTLALGDAMVKTGAAGVVAEWIIGPLATFGPRGALSGVILLSMALATVISKNAAALCITPVAISIAVQLGVEPRAFIMGVCLGASSSFLMPVSNQTHLMVYSAGQYRTRDFLKVGLPLSIGIWIMGSAIIPWIWPL